MSGALRRINKELADLNKNPIDGVSLNIAGENMHHLKCSIVATPESPYKGGTFHFDMDLPMDFPFKPPKVQFTTKIYHPGINDDGSICVPILKEEWKPSTNLSSVLSIIQEKVNNPSAEDPFQPEIAAMLKDDNAKFLTTAKAWTKQYATS